MTGRGDKEKDKGLRDPGSSLPLTAWPMVGLIIIHGTWRERQC